MKLYYSKGACSLAVRIVMHEIGLKSAYEAVNLKTKKTETDKDFLLINPKGAVPVLEIETGAILTENAAILQYLADSNHATTLLSPVGDFKRYRIIEWLNFVSTDLHKSCGALFNAEVPEDLKKQIFIPLLKRKIDFVEKSLGEKNYLLGDTFTLPDAYLYVVLSWLKHFGIDINNWPNVARYFHELKQRNSIVNAEREEESVKA